MRVCLFDPSDLASPHPTPHSSLPTLHSALHRRHTSTTSNTPQQSSSGRVEINCKYGKFYLCLTAVAYGIALSQVLRNLSHSVEHGRSVYYWRFVGRCTRQQSNNVYPSYPAIACSSILLHRLLQVVRYLRLCSSLCVCIWGYPHVGMTEGPRPKLYSYCHYCSISPSLHTLSFTRQRLIAARIFFFII